MAVPHKKIEPLKFGGRFEARAQMGQARRANVVWPMRFWAVPRLYRLEPWSKIERIACVVEL